MNFDTNQIRNIVLLGHSGSGKTTFSETMLYEAGELKRRGNVDDGSTVSDFTNIEKERVHSMFSTMMHANWKDSKLNIIDTPGLDDFVGEVVSSLKVADTAVLLINSAHGVEVGTELVWEHVQKNNTPTLFVVNQVDHEKSNFEKTLDQIKNRFGSKAIQVQYPLNQGKDFNTIVDALQMVMYVFPEDGGKPEKHPIAESELDKAQILHNELVEAAAENDEGLMEKFFEDGSLTEEELRQGLNIALAKGEIYPVFCASALNNMGSGRIMGFINDICPAPHERPDALLADGSELKPDKDGKPVIFIYKTLSEPQVGKVSYFKVYSGTLRSGDELYNLNTENSERFSQIYIGNGKNRVAVDSLVAGDIGIALKLKDSHTNDTISEKGSLLAIQEIDFPNSRIRTAISTDSKGDMEKLMKALHALEEEDPTLEVELSPQLKQTLLHGQGQLHLDLVKYRISKVNQIDMEFDRPRIPYRETITTMAEASYRHKKQSGGAGQFAEVHMRIEPYYEDMPDPEHLNVRNRDIEELPWGGTLAFYWCIVGGAIDAKYSNAIKKGIMQKMEEGPLTGSACQDIRVCIFDGKMHSVDSNDMAFMLAASHGFSEAFEKAKPKLLEPIYKVTVLCDDSHLGDVMGDLQTRRAIIHGMDSDGHYQKIIALVPVVELYQYSSALRSITHGRAKFEREFDSYQEVSHELQQELVRAHKSNLQEA